MTSVLDLESSNNEIIKLITSEKPFIICRVSDNVTKLSLYYKIHNKIHTHFKNLSNTHDGIYSKNDRELILYCNLYIQSIINMDLFACFSTLYNNTQNYIINHYNISKNSIIHNRSLEPFYQLQENIKPWSHYLLGKKVLVINPFVESFKKQLNAGFTIFKDKRIFLQGQEFVFYKSFQTIAGNHIHNNWYETFTIMCKDIEKIEFDIALLGCGGYGLPLSNYIKTKLNKSAIYIGGGLQLLFGVMGKRWENNPFWKKIIKDNHCKFIRPSKEERCKNSETIENGCYW